MTIDSPFTVLHTQPMQPERISWTHLGKRLFGHVNTIRHGYILATTDTGEHHAVKRRDAAREG